MTDDDYTLLDTVSLVKNNYTEVALNEINFKYINQVRGEQVYTESLQSIVSAKAKYGRSLGLARKLLDLAQKLDCFNEVNGMFQNFIDNKQQELLQKQQEITDKDVNEKENEKNCFNPITSRRRGRPPNRYLSEGEIAKQKKVKVDHEGNLLENKEMDNNKKQRRCKGCQETGHDLRNCKNKVLGEKN
ncbi:hypothetical protein RhiirA4_428235 [Rhizophagus irregularis]|uniref:CCHC-type domain-containing protein n=1 Tax=Rhizophagus irregularis TaxID=588596 RepID=A0A2I1HC66_9GLOM|nr:hypothetical protein RhiirA4_428235 [Rhizophagus irregularis]